MEKTNNLKCEECNSEFKSWNRTIMCTYGCDDGTYESDRDYATVFIICPGCKGTGEQFITEESFCCDECIEEHIYKNEEY